MAGKSGSDGPELFTLNAKAADRDQENRRRVIFLKPPRQRDGEPDDRGDMPDGTPIVEVSPPDIAAQIATIGNVCPPPDSLLSDAQALRNLIVQFFPSVEVRPTCRPGAPAIESFGVWLDPAQSPAESAARDRALEALSLLEGEETFGIFVRTRAVNALAQAQFASMPHRLSGDLTAQSDGPIHLERLSVELHPPDTVITRVEGFDDRPWPDIHFTFSITDTLSRERRLITCAEIEPTEFGDICCSSTSDTDLDDADVALAVLLGWGGAMFSALLGGYLFGQLAAAASTGAPSGNDDQPSCDDGGAVGCQILKLAHMTISRPNRGMIGSKLIPTFQRMTINDGGIFLSGQRNLCIRRPTVAILGPAMLSTREEAGTVVGRYTADTEDTFGRLRFHWSSNDARIESPASASTRILFDVDAEHPEPLRRTIHLDVSDGDGPLPRVSMIVTARSIAPPDRHDPAPRQPD